MDTPALLLPLVTLHILHVLSPHLWVRFKKREIKRALRSCQEMDIGSKTEILRAHQVVSVLLRLFGRIGSAKEVGSDCIMHKCLLTF